MASIIAEYQRFLESLVQKPVDEDIRRMANWLCCINILQDTDF